MSRKRYPCTADSTTSSGGFGSDGPQSSSKSKSSGDEAGGTTNSQTSPGKANGPSTSGSPPIPTNDFGEPSDLPTIPGQANANQPSKGTSVRRLKDKPSRSSRSTSVTGGVQVVLDETSSWSDLTDPSSTIPSEGKGDHKGKQGMLGFLSRKGRGSSPKPQERGVLGREGARHIVS